MEDHKPKISIVEIYFVSAYVILIDGIEIALTFAAFDDFWILDILASAVTAYIFYKGLNASRYLATWALEFIPYVGNLPLLTVGFFLTVLLDRNPKLAAAAGKIAAAKGGVQKLGGKPGGAPHERGAAPSGAAVRPQGTTSFEPQFAAGGGRVGAGAQEGGAYAQQTQSPGKAGVRPEEGKAPGGGVSEEAFGMRKEPIEQVKELFKRPPDQRENVTMNGNEVNLKKSEPEKKAA